MPVDVKTGPEKETPRPKVVARDASQFWVELPINTPKGKARVKRREHPSDFGRIISACSNPLERTDFIEWQVSYDLEVKNAEQTTLPDKQFTNHDEKQKFPAGLSEIVFWAKTFGFLTDDEIRQTFQTLTRLETKESFFDAIEPSREVLPDEPKNGFLFQRRNVAYPLFICNRESFTIEIAIQEQQNGSAVQPMLYLCFPVKDLKFYHPCFERKPKAKEKRYCDWIVKPSGAQDCLFAFLLLGMLSSRHRDDTRAILSKLFPDILKTCEPANL